MKKIILLIAILPMLLFSFNVSATHLMGGNLCYDYIGPDGTGKYRYLIKGWVYRDMSGVSAPGSMWSVTIREDDPVKGYPTITTVTLDKIGYEQITLIGEKCDFPCNGCTRTEKHFYEKEVSLPMTLSGFHVFWSSCCRNGSIVNIVPGSQLLYTFIPATFYENSSACFEKDPVPVICKGDTICMNNNAYDQDGDLLVFRFGSAYSSIDFPPAPGLVSFTEAAWKTGYADSMPFGPKSYTFLNGVTGQSCFSSPYLGNYVIALEVFEYRNGYLLSETRREMQVLSTDCWPNYMPKFVNINGSTSTPGDFVSSYYVEEGRVLKFPITAVDFEGDSLFVKREGRLFDPLYVSPPAQMIDSTGGDSLVKIIFNWRTTCGLSALQPYTFSVTAEDNGCPEKIGTQLFAIYVIPPILSPDNIIGLKEVCPNSSSYYTLADTFQGCTYNWSIAPNSPVTATITNSNTDNYIMVDWGSGLGTATITCIKDIPCLDENDTITYLVSVANNGNIFIGNDTTLLMCRGQDMNVQLEALYNASYTYSWTPTNALDNASIYNPLASPISTTVYTCTATQNSCTGTRDITVYVKAPPNVWGKGDTTCSGGVPMRLFAYGAESYLWSPVDSLSDPTVYGPYSTIGHTTTYTVTGTDTAGCTGSADIIALVENTLPGLSLTKDTFIVLGGSIPINVSHGDIISVKWSPATGLSCTDCFNPIATPNKKTVYYVDMTTADSCVYKDSVIISVVAPLEIPNAFTPNGDGVNDQIQAINAGGVSTFHLKIFNRWGKIIFESTDINQSWDGTYNGENQPTENYTYHISAVYEDGNELTLKGIITLLR